MSLSPEQREYLQALGIEVWLPRDHPLFAGGGAEQESRVASKPGLAPPQARRPEAPQARPGAAPPAPAPSSWEALQAAVAGCRRCGLHQGRTQTVFGVGKVDADWMLIGEAPGAEEDRRGEPFVGRAGKLLDSMLRAVGLSREQVFIANILKCRPPNNRDPKPDEVAACEDYLAQQIRAVQPKLILALGRVAAQNLLKTETPIGKMRGNRYRWGDPAVPVVVTYHPAYLLRAPREKRKSWQDLQLAMKTYKEAAQ